MQIGPSQLVIDALLQDTLPLWQAEYRGMALGVCEGLWISFILNDLSYPSQQSIQLYCDNKVARDIAQNPV